MAVTGDIRKIDRTAISDIRHSEHGILHTGAGIDGLAGIAFDIHDNL